MKRRGRVTALVTALAMILSVLGGRGSPAKADTTAAPETGNTVTAATGDTTTAAGGGQKTEPRKTVTLRMWGGAPAETGPRQVCDNFNELYRDESIQVEYERFVNDNAGNLELEINLLSEAGVDVYMIYTPDMLAKRIGGNMALDLSELMVRDGFDLTAYLGTMAEFFYVDGRPYSVPTELDQYGVVINKNMFDEAGTPAPTDWTYDGFWETAKKLTHGGGQGKVYGMFWNSQQDSTYLLSCLVAQTNGGDPMYLNGTETNFQDPVVIKSVELLNNMVNVDKTSPTHADPMTQKLSQEGMFLTGKCAITVGPWMARNIKDAMTYPHSFATMLASYPVMEKGRRDFTQDGYGDHLCINPKSENINVAWEFVKWYATEGMLPITSDGCIPASNTFDPEEVVRVFLEGTEGHIDMETFMKVLITPADNHAVPSTTNHIAGVKKVVVEELEKIFVGQETVKDGMAKAKERAGALLK